MSSLGLHSISYEKDWVLQKLVTQKHQQAKRKQSFQSLLSVDKGLREEKTSKTNLFQKLTAPSTVNSPVEEKIVAPYPPISHQQRLTWRTYFRVWTSRDAPTIPLEWCQKRPRWDQDFNPHQEVTRHQGSVSGCQVGSSDSQAHPSVTRDLFPSHYSSVKRILIGHSKDLQN